MGIPRTAVWTVAVAAAAFAGAAAVYLCQDALRDADLIKPLPQAARQVPDQARESRPRTLMVASVGGEGFATRGDFAVPSMRSSSIAAIPAMNVPADDPDDQVQTAAPAETAAPEAPQPEAFASPQPAEAAQSEETDETGNVTPTLEGRVKGGKRGLVVLHIGDSHTSADFLTGELRKRLQAKYGRGAPGYITAGHPHIGVRTSSLKVTASSGWSYKSLQRPDAAAAEFWLSGYNAVTSSANETMSFVSDQPQQFDTIEIEVVRHPGGGSIDIKLDGAVETTYDLSSSKVEPVVIRLVPTRAPIDKVREIAITTKGKGPVMIASVAIYNRQTGITYNSVGYPGAQATLINKLSSKLFANDLIRINPQIVVLSFGTNEASNDGLDIARYTASYEAMVGKIKATLPKATIVVISPPDFSEAGSGGKKEKDKSGTREASAAKGKLAASGSDCGWHTPVRLGQVREAQRDVAQRLGLVYWNWASIMPSECGAHRWYTASPPLMAKDHVHFTAEGYRKSAAEFLNTLIPVIEKVRVSANAVSNN
jgi:lysophospholipase L1-like esterase